MTCRQAQSSLSLYLYGELDFDQEEGLELHLAECAACQLSLAREKEWHALASAQTREAPLKLLAECRQTLETAHPAPARPWRPFASFFEISATRWSAQIALASMLVFIGFVSARWLDRPAQNLAAARIRDIQADSSGLVRVVLERETEIAGRADDAGIRSLLLAGTRQLDPGVRYSSFAILTGLGDARANDELRQVVAYAVRNDPNPAVRLQALEGLRHFSGDPSALEVLKFALQNDDNPGVRSQAIDILAPPGGTLVVTPASAQAIQDVMRSSPEDEYVRARCAQWLREANLPMVY